MEDLKPKVVCAWCNKVIRDGDYDTDVSHGICKECYENEIKKLDEMKGETS